MNRRMLILAAALTFGVPSALFAQSLVFVVRHAERADAGMTAGAGADPDLSEAGRSRAESLAAMLKDARISAIYVTEFKRTRQTAEPLAKILGLEPTVVSSKDDNGLIERLKSSSGNALVIGHSNTVPAILKALAGETVTIGDTEFDNLFVITGGTSRSLLRLRYR
jgi:2,3-bisphosphoglycerate-dependent phosphoglycerate mutase